LLAAFRRRGLLGSAGLIIAGRTDNMLANQRAAAVAGLKHGAIGYLNTDWGDFGHLQYWPISLAGLAAGAAMSWCAEAHRDLPLEKILDRHAFFDEAAVMGKLACDLGNIYRTVGKLLPNRSALFNVLVPSAARRDPMEGITLEQLQAAEAAIAEAIEPLESSRMQRSDGALIQAEFRNAAVMLSHACRKGRWKLGNGPRLQQLAEELHSIIQSHRECWLKRNRAGGLEDSVSRLADHFQEYRKEAKITGE
jgi:hexosaminidase